MVSEKPKDKLPISFLERESITDQISKSILQVISESGYEISALDFLMILEETKKAGLKKILL